MKVQVNIAFVNFAVFKQVCTQQGVDYIIIEERSDSNRVEIYQDSSALLFYFAMSFGLQIGQKIAMDIYGK